MEAFSAPAGAFHVGSPNGEGLAPVLADASALDIGEAPVHLDLEVQLHLDLEVQHLLFETKKKRAVLSGVPEEEPVACIEVGSRARKLRCVPPAHHASPDCTLPEIVAIVAMPQDILT